MTDKTEGIAATAATGVSIGSVLVDANEFLQLLITISTVLWWVRLWIHNPNIKPPGSKPRKP